MLEHLDSKESHDRAARIGSRSAKPSIDKMFDLIKQDARRYINPKLPNDDIELSARDLLLLWYRYLPLRALMLFRFGSWLHVRGIPFFPNFLQRFIYQHYGLEIVISADIGGGLYIPHLVGMIIAPRKIGRNCSLIASITIGMRNEWEFPTIGDNVFIGAGARVLGGIIVGDGAIIGANAVVISDVPAGATAVGVPARVRASNPR